MKIFNYFLSAVFPNKCIGCGDILDEEKSLCEYCEKHIERIDLSNICLSCGYESDNCVCNYNIYRFERLASVFKNKDIAQRAYYSYKFNQKQHYAGFFAQEMSNAVNTLYADTNFDFICSVPSRQKYGFDHCGYIAREMSEILKLPYANDVLYCKRRGKSQHKSSIKERLVNVNDKYSYNRRIDGTAVLLIDDIRTTGATLDECAKMLLYAGADSVCCVTALATVINSKKKIENS